MASALELFSARCNAAHSTVLVFYRGERSFFCKQWLRRWLAIPAIERRLELADVLILFISAQSQGKAFSVAAQIAANRPALDNRVRFFGDPEHLLVTHLRMLGFAHPVVTNPESHRAHGWVFDFGMLQPAVVAVAADGHVLYQWVSKPSLLNVAGKLDRPDPFDVWDTIERRLDRIRIGKARAARETAFRRATYQRKEQPIDHLSLDTEQATVVAQPSIHSVGNVVAATIHAHQDAREEKSDSELLTSVPRLPSDRKFRRVRERTTALPKKEMATQVGDSANTSPNRMNSDIDFVPLSTNVETVLQDTFTAHHTMTNEEPDLSDGDIPNIQIHHLSEDINALANEVLKENTMSLEMSMREKAIEAVTRQVDKKRNTALLTTDFVDEFDDFPQSKPYTDGEIQDEEKLNSIDSDFKDVELVDDTNDESSNDEDFSADDFEQLQMADDEAVPSTHSTRATSRVDSSAEPKTQPRFLDYFDLDQQREEQTQPSSEMLVDNSVPSMGSDQVDSSLLTNRYGSIRTEDSSHVNTVHFGLRGFSMDRQIVEEADDKKVGISDYLRELKEPEKRHYRVRDMKSNSLPYSHTVIRTGTSFKIEPEQGDREKEDLDATKLSRRVLESTIGVNGSNEVFRDEKTNGIDNIKSATGETDSPHPELNGGSNIVVDISPFADANHGMEKRAEEQSSKKKTKMKLRDEYEAYDEYIVCEFEVEEYVEEYDSDTLSRSRVFVSGLIDEESHEETVERRIRIAEEAELIDSGVEGQSSEGGVLEPVIESGEVRAALGKRGRRAFRDGPDGVVMTPGGSRFRLPESGEVDRNVEGITGMRWILKRIGVSMRGSRMEKHLHDGELTQRTQDGGRSAREGDADEEERVGRKETLRAVLRRLPGSKWHGVREEEDGTRYVSGDGGNGGCGGGGVMKRSGLQAVLQRLPSLNRGSRGKGRGEGDESCVLIDSDGRGLDETGNEDGEDEGERVSRKRSVALFGGSKHWRFRLG